MSCIMSVRTGTLRYSESCLRAPGHYVVLYHACTHWYVTMFCIILCAVRHYDVLYQIYTHRDVTMFCIMPVRTDSLVCSVSCLCASGRYDVLYHVCKHRNVPTFSIMSIRTVTWYKKKISWCCNPLRVLAVKTWLALIPFPDSTSIVWR